MSDVRMYYQDTDWIELPYYSEADPSGLIPKIAIKPHGTAALPGDLVTAEWTPDETWTGGRRNARLLIGPTSPFGALTPGIYRMYLSVDDNPEDPFKKAPNHLVIEAS